MPSPYGFWTFSGKNGLKGKASTLVTLDDGRVVTVKDPDNPAVLEDTFIVYCLHTSRRARYEFNRLYPSLLPEEQERLTNLLNANPKAKFLITDPQQLADDIQHRDITSGVHPDVSTRASQFAAINRLHE